MRTKISRLKHQPRKAQKVLGNLGHTRSNSRDMNTTLNTFFLVAGSTGAAILMIASWYSCSSKAQGLGKWNAQSPKFAGKEASQEIKS